MMANSNSTKAFRVIVEKIIQGIETKYKETKDWESEKTIKCKRVNSGY